MQKYRLFIVILIIAPLFGKNNILSTQQQKIFEYSKEQIKADSNKLKYEWINPITYTYSQNLGEKSVKSRKSTIAISQPIFKSGGIFSAIKYASATQKHNDTSLKISENEAIKLATTTLFNIYKTKLLIDKQKLLIKNSTIDINKKKDSVLNGILDITFLNNAILTSNKQKIALVELEFNKKNLINTFDNLASKPYNKFNLPVIELINKNDFLTNNIYLKQNKQITNSKRYLKEVTSANYKPTVNINYSYVKNHTTDTTLQTYGFNIVVPFDIKFKDAIQSKKLDYLKSKEQEEITKKKEINFLNTEISKVEMINQKIQLTKLNIKTYDKLLDEVKELESAGIKTKDDVLVLENSKSAEELTIEIYKIEKQIELLDIYSRVTNAI